MPVSFAPTSHVRREWQVSSADPESVRELSIHLSCPAPIAHLLVARGINTPTLAEAFFHPKLADLHSPHLLLGMNHAVARIQQAVSERQPILIYGDYDVDGTIATVLLKTAIERIAPLDAPAKVTWHVPHRIREGYGMQGSRLAEAAKSGVRLVISVDTGIRAFAAAGEAKQLGLDLIVTDHHLPDDSAALPEAIAVLNPAQAGCPYPFKPLCGAAVAFKLAHALLLAHVAEQPDADAQLLRLNRSLLPSFLKLVAIASIADAVPLVGENRDLALLGLRELANPVQPGLRELFRVANLPVGRPPSATDIGFRIAPRINAAGRMDVADDVVELFLTRSPERATELAEKLDRLNEERRATEREALDDIEQRLTTILATHNHYPTEPIVFDHQDWHRGVIGILAARIVDRTERPALVITYDGLQAYGSGRSVPGFHLLDALTSVHHASCATTKAGELFSRFGGHAHAVGFSLAASHVSLLRDRLRTHGKSLLTSNMPRPPRVCDAEIPKDLLCQDICRWIERCAPFGNGHPEPIFSTRSLELAAPVRLIKDRHVCLKLMDSNDGRPMQAIGWSREISWPAVCRDLSLSAGTAVDLVYRLRARSGPWFDGLELELVDIRLSSPSNLS